MSPHPPHITDEFPPGAGGWPAGISRRRFLEYMAASLGLAGLGACNRPPEKSIVPYVVPPERELLDAAVYYATAMPWEGYARGVLALSRSGRPTKLEGNPAHPDSLGATDAVTQAAVLSLYDPDRSRAPRRFGRTVSWAVFENAWLESQRERIERRGAGLAMLTEPTTSPTRRRLLHRLLERFPDARWFQHTPGLRYDRGDWQDDYDFARADVVLAIDADFLSAHPSSLRYARAFAGRRRIEHGRVNANRLYVFEPGVSVTGSMADRRLPVSPARLPLLLAALNELLAGERPRADLRAEELGMLEAVARDLRARAPRVLCLAGAHCPAALHTACDALNARLGADGVTRHVLPAVRSDGDSRCAGDLAALAQAMGAGEITALVIAGTNPAYTAPADLEFEASLATVRQRIHFGEYHDETAALCEWHVPEAHWLESWSDLCAFDGALSIVQPLIAPMYGAKSAEELLGFLSDPAGRSGYDLVRETARESGLAGDNFENAWHGWLEQGLISNTAAPRRGLAPRPATGDHSPPVAARPAGVTAIFRADPTIGDGRWANNGWLQELPKPLTHLVWDNAAHVSPAFAAMKGLANGDRIEIRAGDRTLTAPAWIVPGHAADSITLTLGYGRTGAGSVGNGRGYNAYRLRTTASPWQHDAVEVRKLGGTQALVSTQSHFAMEGRELVRTSGVRQIEPLPQEPRPSLYPTLAQRGYQWGMAIDLATCIGCSACVVACQAENNIPVVGPEQVARGREMHWLRVDTYYSGPPENPEVLHQPVPCMQCENAPCEVVCPVAATVHSAEGLNDMIYNRCVGTRYCSNNCPYKVRRFNFLDYRTPPESSLQLQKNPEVSIRARGVMEKCTYCVQRINAGRIAAESESRHVRDGEIRPACQQACPAEAIVFGDINDPSSRVMARKSEPTHYALLGELNTRPRTTYLARITNREGPA